MKALHAAYRVSDLAASLDFYTALGYGRTRLIVERTSARNAAGA